jgi:hypothetical protein
VIEPATLAEVTDDDVDRAARDAVASGSSARDAAVAVAQQLGVSKRRAYDAVIAARRAG